MVTDTQLVLSQLPSALTKYVVVPLGATLIVGPVPIETPPQLPEYQCHTAPEPSEPPVRLRVVESPMQTGFALAFTDVGTVELLLTVMVVETQVVVLQLPSALTK
jgi:hypothetical protein